MHVIVTIMFLCIFVLRKFHTLYSNIYTICYRIKVEIVFENVNFVSLKDLNSTVAKRGSVFIGLMTPDGAIWSRYQRAVLMK